MRLVVVSAVLLLAAQVFGEPPGPGNLIGHRGVLRSAAANNNPAGWIGVGTDFQYFTKSDFLTEGDKHARMVNTYSIAWAPFRFLEGAFALHVTSDRSQHENGTEELMVAVGDPEISLKGGTEIGHGVAVGGLFDLRFPAASGFFAGSGSATSFQLAALASWSAGARIPFAVHLNVGFQYDGSEKLFDDPSKLSQAQLNAAQVSSFHRVVTRLGVEYNTRYVGPFVELSLEPFVGGGAPGFGDSPGLLSFGARVWPTKSKSLQLLAALDIGITGVGGGDVPAPAAEGDYYYVVPRWNFVLRAAYYFDAYKRDDQPVREVEAPPPPVVVQPKFGTIGGVVLDEQTGKPVWNAQVSVDGAGASNLIVDSRSGAFRTYKLEPGKHTLVATAEGYGAARTVVEVEPEGTASVSIKLAPKTAIMPGTLRGTVKALVGKNPKEATILIPELDRTIRVDESGTFSVELKPGKYRVEVSAPGFRTQTKQVQVYEGSTVIFNVELYR